jgi:hypothetical protein
MPSRGEDRFGVTTKPNGSEAAGGNLHRAIKWNICLSAGGVITDPRWKDTHGAPHSLGKWGVCRFKSCGGCYTTP